MRTALQWQSAILSCTPLMRLSNSASAQSVLPIAMTASDIPLSTGQAEVRR